MLAWVGLVLSPLCLYLIKKIFKSISKENFPSLNWTIWFALGFAVSYIHLLNYPDSLSFYEESGFKPQNSIKRAMSTIVQECERKKSYEEINPRFFVPDLTGYVISPKNGSCSGDDLGEIKAIRKQSNILFNWWALTSYNPFPSKSLPKALTYNVETGVKTCVPGENDHFCLMGGWW